MTPSDNANLRLNEAIALIKGGQVTEGRDLLRALSQQYPANELVWLWLATASADPAERLAAIRQTLSINPRNEKARAALTQLTGEEPPLPPAAAPDILPPISPTEAQPAGEGTGSRTLELMLIFGLAGAAIVIGLLLLTNVVIPRLQPTATPTPSRTPRPTITLTPTIPTATPTPSYTPGGPTITPPGPTLPPTWTPRATNTLRPTNTPRDTLPPPPSRTPVPSRTYTPSFTPFPTRTPFPTDTPAATVPPTNTEAADATEES